MTYIFDFDGTLVDSMPIFAKTILRILDENNIKYPQNIVRTVTPLGYRGVAEYVKSLGFNKTTEEFLNLAESYMLNEYKNNIPAKKYVKEKLIKLKSKGESINVLTASPHTLIDDCLKRLDLYDLFDNVWSSDDFGLKKSEPEIYTKAAEKLNKNIGECVFVDDNLGAVTAAKKAGMFTVGIFDESSEDDAPRMKKTADRYVFDFREI